MGAIFISRNSSDQGAAESELTGLRKALDGAYGRVLQTARREWGRNFGGFDPSDACVSVRISGGNSLRSQRYLAA
jgi:hypothetical protein